MRVGDEVICIRVFAYDVCTGARMPHPALHEELVIAGFETDAGFEGWLRFDSFPDMSFEPWNFRKVEHHTVKFISTKEERTPEEVGRELEEVALARCYSLDI
jgi:hypothetical protein